MKLRRLFSLFIAVALIVTMLPLGAIATETEELISEPVAAPEENSQEEPAPEETPDETIEVPEESEELPSDVIGETEEPAAEDPKDETPEQPAAETPDEQAQPEETAEVENPEETPGEEAETELPEGEEIFEDEETPTAAAPVDVTTLYGEELARYFETLEANQDIEGLMNLVAVLTEAQIESLKDVPTTSMVITEMLRAGTEEEEVIPEYYPASSIPAGPIVDNTSESADSDVQSQMSSAKYAATRAIVNSSLASMSASFSTRKLAAGDTFVNPPANMTVNKTASVAGTYANGRQWFKLDLTVNVTGTIVTTTKPADIILVLDRSGSMADMISSNEYYPITSSPDTGEVYYINVDGNWEEVEYHSYWWWGNWYYGSTVVYYQAGGTGANGNYQFYSNRISKMDALKSAVNSFLQNVYAQSPESRVAIVSYSGSSSVDTGTKNKTSGAFVSISNSSGTGVNSALTTAVNSLSASGGTRADQGFANATPIMQDVADDANAADRTRVVIHFTDGDPGDQGFNQSNHLGETVAADVIRWAKVLKNDRGATTTVSGVTFDGQTGDDTISPTTGCGATVYTIGIFTNPSSETHQYMWRTSSETKDGSTKSGSNPDYSPNAAGNKGYYLTANSTSSLNNIFEQISQQIGDPVTDATIRDYITNGFEVCDASGNAINITTLPVTVGDYTINSDANGIYVQWTGVNIDVNTSITKSLYVKPKADFIGGNNLKTNKDNISAIYAGSTILASFPTPTVNVPIMLGTGAYSDDIYLGDSITAVMTGAAETDILADIFKGYDYSAIGTVVNDWITDPTGLTPTASTNGYGYLVTVNPTAAAAASVGTPAISVSANGTYTVNVYGATLTATGFTILKGQTADLATSTKTLTWSTIAGKTPPASSEISYTVYYNSQPVAGNPQLTENRTFTVVARRNGVQVASADFTVTVVCPTFSGATYNILLGENVGSRYTVTNSGVTANYGSIVLRYGAGELTYTPDYSGYGSTLSSFVPTAAGTYTVPVTVYYGSTSTVIGTASVAVNVYKPAFTGKTFDLLNGEPASADGFSAASDGITIDYTGIPAGLTYNEASLTYAAASGSTLLSATDRPSADTTCLVDVSYNGAALASNVAITFKVYTPAFSGNTYNLFYGETVKNAYTGVNTFADAITITKPASWPAAKDSRWTAYEAKITGAPSASYTNALTTVFAPGAPAAQFPVAMTYTDGTFSRALTTDATAPQITINVTAGTITIAKSVSANNKGTVDVDQTFLFKITRTDGSTTEVSYEYITGNGTKTLSGLKKGTYTVQEVTDWAWRYDCTSATTQTVTLGRTGTGSNPFTATGSTSFTNVKTTDSWLGDEAIPVTNNCGTVPASLTHTASDAIMPGKQTFIPDDGPVEA